MRDVPSGIPLLATVHVLSPRFNSPRYYDARNGRFECRSVKAIRNVLTPVVLITGLSATGDRIKGINAGADDFLSKPIDFNELLARTRSLLRLKQYTDDLENAEGVLFSLAYRNRSARPVHSRPLRAAC